MTVAELVKPAVWHGSPEQRARLDAAILANCAERETLDAVGRSGDRCLACDSSIVLLDQAELDRWAFAPAGDVLAKAEQTEAPGPGGWWDTVGDEN